ncbi:MAG: hypothetical protein D6814_12685 [Calditrichaeota bacterium]|nr:MAG: hypothetical protein D6814_12685 [Calditrichota bacterium]
MVFLLGCPPKPPDQIKPGDPLPGLSESEMQQFENGRKVFERVFVPADGLGPLFNGEGCASCHAQPVPGGSSAIIEVHASRFIAPDNCDPLFQEGGPVIQQHATPLLQNEGVEKEEIPPSASGEARRSSPPLFGFGLIDAIPEDSLLANADPEDADGDGISGRANRFLDGRLGRFGRKAFLPTLFEFNAGAFPIEQGVTTPFQPVEETLNGTPIPPQTDPVPEPEVSVEEINAVTAFVRFLAPPSRAPESSYEIKKGGELFDKIGCAKCHIPSMKSGPNDSPALDRKEVFLYSDLLLHDMGPELKDICLGLASPSEFRTETLLGLRFRKQFLHDGSATTVREAIERHGGEAEASTMAFKNLTSGEQEALLKFLDTL